jgi:hypothetical protein
MPESAWGLLALTLVRSALHSFSAVISSRDLFVYSTEACLTFGRYYPNFFHTLSMY